MAGEEVFRGATPDYAGNAYGEEAQVVAAKEASLRRVLGRSRKGCAKCGILAR